MSRETGPVTSRSPERDAERSYQTRIIGAQRAPFRDLYHAFLRLTWGSALGTLVIVYLLLNGCFAVAYFELGGIANARPGSLPDAFYFSVQTMGTIGYGSMYPTGTAANLLVVLESVIGLVVTALATGLVFAKFSQSTARIAFTRQAVIALMDGVPTLMFRVGNERDNQIIEARLRVVLIRTEKTAEGMTFYRMYDLPLSRERSPAFSRSWTAMHPIQPGSLLYGQTPASLEHGEVELIVTLVGVDETSLQPVHARKVYEHDAIVWGARHVDILVEDVDGNLTLDLNRFHDLGSTVPTPDFPYPGEQRAPGQGPSALSP